MQISMVIMVVIDFVFFVIGCCICYKWVFGFFLVILFCMYDCLFF